VSKPGLSDIQIKKTRLDGGTQPRVEMDLALIGQYAECLDELPPVEAVFDGEWYWIFDGFHRVEAHKKEGRKVIRANVRRGTRREAVLLSVGVNATHGLRRTNADIRRAVETLLKDPEWREWPNTKIAEYCAVSRQTVANHRAALAEKETENNGQTGGCKVSIFGPAVSGMPLLPEQYVGVYDSLTPEQKALFAQDDEDDGEDDEELEDLSSWLERVEGACVRLTTLFKGRPEVSNKDRKAVEQRVGTVLQIARKYEG
jgi:hypothetical protein